MFEKVDALQEKLQMIRREANNPIDTEKSIREKLIVDWTYHSNAMEGNRLSLIETRVVLESGMTIGGKPIKDHLEAIDHKEAILYLEKLAQKENQLTERHIKQIHAIVFQRIRPRDAGQYRHVPVVVGDHIPPQPWEVPIQMEQLFNDYQHKWHGYHPIKKISYLHCDFVRIHPFIDGNGRTARLIMNLALMQHGYPPVILPVEDRTRYYESLQQYDDTGDPQSFMSLLVQLVEKSLLFYLKVYGHSPET